MAYSLARTLSHSPGLARSAGGQHLPHVHETWVRFVHWQLLGLYSRRGFLAEPHAEPSFFPCGFQADAKSWGKTHNMPITLASKPQMIVYSCWQMKPCSKHLVPNWINLQSPALGWPALLPSCHGSNPLPDPVLQSEGREACLVGFVIHKKREDSTTEVSDLSVFCQSTKKVN